MDQPTDFINSAVIHAIETGNVKLIQELLARFQDLGSFIDANYLFKMALPSTSRMQTEVARIVDLLLTNRMPIIQDHHSARYLRFAVENEFYEMIYVLLKHRTNTDHLVSMRNALAIVVISYAGYEEVRSADHIRRLVSEFETKGILQALIDYKLISRPKILAHYSCANESELITTLWFDSCSWGRTDTVRHCLEKYQECRTPENLQKALKLSGKWGHPEVVNLLIGYLPNPADLQNVEVCEETLRIVYVFRHSVFSLKPEWINSKDEDILKLAVKNSCVDCLEHLLNSGWDLNHVFENEQGKTPLHLAVQKGHLEVVKLLISRGCKIDAVDISNRTGLHIAAKRGRYEVARYLLENGADLTSRDWMDNVPLHIACLFRNYDVVRLFIENSVDINIKGNRNRTALVIACSLEPETIKLVKYLIEKGANVNHLSQGGWAPLAIAAPNGYSEIIKLLLKNGADPNHKSSGLNESILMLVCRSDTPSLGHKSAADFYAGIEDTIKLLVSYGAEPIYDARYNAFDFACMYPRYLKILKQTLPTEHTEKWLSHISLENMLVQRPAFLQNTYVVIKAVREIIDSKGGIGDITLATFQKLNNRSIELKLIKECCGYLKLSDENDRELDSFVRLQCRIPDSAIRIVSVLRESGLLGHYARSVLNRVFCSDPSIKSDFKSALRSIFLNPLTLGSWCRISIRQAIARAGKKSVVSALNELAVAQKLKSFVAWRNLSNTEYIEYP